MLENFKETLEVMGMTLHIILLKRHALNQSVLKKFHTFKKIGFR